jgi:hypothetical protein
MGRNVRQITGADARRLPARRQACAAPGPSCLQTSITCGQRVRNRYNAVGFSALGTLPVVICRGRDASASGSGIADSSAMA